MTSKKPGLPIIATAVLIGLNPTTDTEASPAIHPSRRASPSPAEGVVVEVNPPALLWPAVRASDVRYSIQLSRDRGFRPADTLSDHDLRWAMFNPHGELASGEWFWRYSVSVKGQPRHRMSRRLARSSK